FESVPATPLSQTNHETECEHAIQPSHGVREEAPVAERRKIICGMAMTMPANNGINFFNSGKRRGIWNKKNTKPIIPIASVVCRCAMGKRPGRKNQRHTSSVFQ